MNMEDTIWILVKLVLSVAAILQFLFQVYLQFQVIVTINYYSFSSYLQSLVFPRVVKILQYRKTFDLGLLLFDISSIILPFSNQISCRIPVQQFNFLEVAVVVTDTSIPICPGSDKSNSTDIIENPITRVPARVWAVIMIITTI